jgi:hypothetical protein
VCDFLPQFILSSLIFFAIGYVGVLPAPRPKQKQESVVKMILVVLSCFLLLNECRAASFLLDNGGSVVRIEADLRSDHISLLEQTNSIMKENPGKYPSYDEKWSFELLPLEPERASVGCHDGFPSDPVAAGDGHCVTTHHTQSCFRTSYTFKWVRRGMHYVLLGLSMTRVCHVP